MKRFTEALKWRDPWFLGLSLDGMLVFFYLVDNCDAAGVWEPNYRLANFCLKRDVDWSAVKGEFGDRLAILPNGKWWLTRFVQFQYGLLTDTCAPHRAVISLVLRHGLAIDKGSVSLPLGYLYPPDRDKEKDKEKEKDQRSEEVDLIPEKQPPPVPITEIVAAFHATCTSLPKILKVTDARVRMIKARWSEAGEYPMEWFQTLFSKAQASDFISGRNGEWTACNLDWLLSPTNALKVLEGNYDNNGRSRGYVNGSEPDRSIYTEPAGWREKAAAKWPGAEIPERWDDLSSALRNDLVR